MTPPMATISPTTQTFSCCARHLRLAAGGAAFACVHREALASAMPAGIASIRPVAPAFWSVRPPSAAWASIIVVRRSEKGVGPSAAHRSGEAAARSIVAVLEAALCSERTFLTVRSAKFLDLRDPGIAPYPAITRDP